MSGPPCGGRTVEIESAKGYVNRAQACRAGRRGGWLICAASPGASSCPGVRGNPVRLPLPAARCGQSCTGSSAVPAGGAPRPRRPASAAARPQHLLGVAKHGEVGGRQVGDQAEVVEVNVGPSISLKPGSEKSFFIAAFLSSGATPALRKGAKSSLMVSSAGRATARPAALPRAALAIPPARWRYRAAGCRPRRHACGATSGRGNPPPPGAPATAVFSVLALMPVSTGGVATLRAFLFGRLELARP